MRLLLLVLMLSGCQLLKNDKEKKEPENKNPSNQIQQPDKKQPIPFSKSNEVSWYGGIGRCIKKVELEDRMDNYIKLKYELLCKSFTSSSLEGLKAQIKKFSENNCPKDFRISDTGCLFTSNRPVQYETTDRDTANEEQQALECAPQKAKTYGKISGCNLNISVW